MRIGVLLSLLSLLSLAACETSKVTYATDYDNCHMFGDTLDACRGARVLCWPADENGTWFRCVEDKIDKEIAKQPVARWPDGVPTERTVGSVIVILPPDASPALRARTGKLMDALTERSPGAGRHVVTADASWKDVTGGDELAKRLDDLHTKAAKWRQTSSDDGLFMTFGDLDQLMPHVVVIPLAGEGDRHLVLEGIRRKTPAIGGWEPASQRNLSSDEIRDLPALRSEEGKPRLMIFEIVVCEKGDALTRDRAMRLSAALLERGHTSVYVRTVANPDIERGVFQPGELEPPYIADWQ